MPSSLQARMIRMAISPRLAIRIFLNILEKVLNKVDDSADDQPGEKVKISNTDIFIFGLQQIRASIIYILYHNFIGCIRVVHNLRKILSIFLIRNVTIIAEEERAVIRV